MPPKKKGGKKKKGKKKDGALLSLATHLLTVANTNACVAVLWCGLTDHTEKILSLALFAHALL